MVNLTKNVFLMILGTVIAMILYFLFFGTPAGNINGVIQWQEFRGMIYYTARLAETPIAKYYYEYSYIPNSHANDYIDDALGGHSTVTDIYNTPSDLSGDTSDYYNFSGTYWSTGWY